jgi:polar amino acid transport system substrate-binding protein
MRCARSTAAALAAAVLLPGCQIPQDPKGTLDRVENGVMRVGVVEADPWVELAGTEPSGGVEVELARAFARKAGARIEWIDGSEEELVNACKEGSVDLVIAGLTSKSRWKKDVAFTRPYVETEAVVGVPSGADLPDSLEGSRVLAERGSEEEALLELKTDAVVVSVDSLSEARGRTVAAHDYVLDDLALRRFKRLKREKHVMAVQPGENAFLVELERFLLNREAAIEVLVRREGRP